MKEAYKSWAIWSAAIFVIWGAVFLVRSMLSSNPSMHDLAILFAGYCIAWLAATIKFVLIVRKLH